MDDCNFDNMMTQQQHVHMRSGRYEFSQHKEEGPMMQAQFRNNSRRGNLRSFSNNSDSFNMHHRHQSGLTMMNGYANIDMNERRSCPNMLYDIQKSHSHRRPMGSNRYPDNFRIHSPPTSASRQKSYPGMFERCHQMETSDNFNRSQFYARPNMLSSTEQQQHGSYTNRNRDNNPSFVQLPSSPPRNPEFYRKQSIASNSFFLRNKENFMLPCNTIQATSKPFYSTRNVEVSSPSFEANEDLTPKKKQKELELDAASILCNLGRIIFNGNKSPRARTSMVPLIGASPSLVSDTQDSLSSISSASEQIHPTRLALPKDESELNSLHCFVRQELLEMFIIPEDEDYKISLPFCSPVSTSEKHEDSASFTPNTPSSSAISSESFITSSQSKTPKKSTYYRGRVGFRCVHCVHAQPRPSFICTNGDKKSRVLDPEVIIQNSNAPMATFYPKSLADLYRLVCTWQRVHFHKCRHIPPSVRNLYHKLKHTDRTRGKTKYWVTSAKEIGLADDPKVGGCVRYYPEAKDQ